ncbi:WD40 repeat domain-containing protein [Calycomorphotria hydatis]|uniref:WD domain, G-beta repeat n=1 Tax=Calycomorphotria hydatis TaxID=2528027 RepID=A0A517T964_9PLAN|nr:hypothetical protein [Calycomorphotria hydatis]QDT64925.1 WD domain, G-beta repeat [Calycomorphotria hydatis]
MAVTENGNNISIYNYDRGSQSIGLNGHVEKIIFGAFAGRDRFVSGDDSGEIKLWDLSTKQEIRKSKFDSRISSWHIDLDQQVVIGTDNGKVYQVGFDSSWDDLSEFKVLENTGSAVSAISSVGKLGVAVGFANGDFQYWEKEQGVVPLGNSGAAVEFLASDGNDTVYALTNRVLFALRGIVKRSPQVRWSREFDFPVEDIQLSSAGSFVIASKNRGIEFVDSSNGTISSRIESEDGVTTVRLLADQRLLVGNNRGKVKAFGSELAPYRKQPIKVSCLAISPDDQWMAIGHQDGSIQLLNRNNAEKQVAIPRLTEIITQICFSDDSQYVAMISADGKLSVFDISEGQLKATRTFPQSLSKISFMDGRHWLGVLWGDSSAIDILDVENLLSLESISLKNDQQIQSFDFSDGEIHLVSSDGRFLSTMISTQRRTQLHDKKGTSITVAANSSLAFTASEDGVIKILRPNQTAYLIEEGPHVLQMDYDEAHDRLAVLAKADSETNIIGIFQATSGVPIVQEELPLCSGISFSGDGKTLSVLQADGKVLFCDAESLKQVETSEAYDDTRTYLYGPYDEMLLLASANEALLLERGTACSRNVSSEAVTSIAYSPSSEVIAAGLSGGTIHLIDAKTGQTVQQLEGHTQTITDLLIPASGAYLASSSLDGQVLLFSFKNMLFDGSSIRTDSILNHVGAVFDLCTLDAEASLAAASEDSIHVWNIANIKETERYVGGAAQYNVQSAISTKQVVSCNVDMNIQLWPRSEIDGERSTQLVEFRADDLKQTWDVREKESQIQTQIAANAPGVGSGTVRIGSREVNAPSNLSRKLERYRSAKTNEERIRLGEELSSEIIASNSSNLWGISPLDNQVANLVDPRFAVPANDVKITGVTSILTDFVFDFSEFKPVRLAISRDGRLLAAARESAKLKKSDKEVLGRVILWDIEIGVPLRDWREVQDSRLDRIEFFADDRVLFTMPDLFFFEILGPRSGESRLIARSATFGFSRDSDVDPLFVVGRKGTPLQVDDILFQIDSSSFEESDTNRSFYESWATAVAVSSDGKLVAAAVQERDNHKLYLFDKNLKQYPVRMSGTSRDNEFLMFDRHGAPWHQAEGYAGIDGLQFSPNGKYLMVRWKRNNGSQMHHYATLWSITVDEEESVVVASQLWQSSNKQKPLFDSSVTEWLRFIKEGEHFIIASEQNLRVVETKSGKMAASIDMPSRHQGIYTYGYSPDGEWLVSGDSAGYTYIWNLHRQVGPYRFRDHLGPVVGVSINKINIPGSDSSDDSQELRVVTIGEENEIHVWSCPEITEKVKTLNTGRDSRRAGR